MAVSGVSVDLRGKAALVTGSTSGIGQATARRLAEAGAQVIVHGRDIERVERVTTELGGDARGVAADLRTSAGVQQLIESARKAVGRVDILVNNAAIIAAHDVLTVTPAQIEEVLRTNAWSGLALAQAFAPDMFKRNDHGRMIGISSDAGVMPQPAMTAYGLSKQVVMFLTRALAEAAARAGADTVTATAVVVGPTSTPGADRYVSQQADDGNLTGGWETVMAHLPYSLLRRPMRPDEVADVVLWLAAPQSAAIRGSVVRVDGGAIPAPL